MKIMKENKNENKNEHILENEELIAALEEQIAATQWIQSAAVLYEAILLTQLYFLENHNNDGENKILAGIWVQTIGQFTEALGVTKEIRTTDKYSIFKAQKMAVTGDWLQSLGAALQGLGGEEALLSDGEDIFIP